MSHFKFYSALSVLKVPIPVPKIIFKQRKRNVVGNIWAFIINDPEYSKLNVTLRK